MFAFILEPILILHAFIHFRKSNIMLQLIKYHFGLEVSTTYLDNNKLTVPRDKLGNQVTVCTSDDLSSSMEFAGNPLSLNEICNLSVADEQVQKNLAKDSILTSTTNFDYSQYHCIKTEELPNAYAEYGAGELLLVIGDGGSPQLVSLFPGDSPMERRLLKIKTDQKPNLKASVPGDLLTRYMPFSQQTLTSFEADYDFPFSTYHTKFPKASIDHPLAAPPDDVVGCLTTQIRPYVSSETPLHRLKRDIDRIKRLCWAYQNEEPWASTLTSKKLEKGELERLIVDRLSAGKHEDTLPTAETETRHLDDTERMWEILKDVPDRRTATSCFKFALTFLRENRTTPYTIGAYDFTQFVTIVRQIGATSQFEVLGLKMLIETGLYKVTNDCLYIIRLVSSELADNFVARYMMADGEVLSMSIEQRLAYLHHLYKLSCLTTALLAALPATIVQGEISSLLMDHSKSETEWEDIMVTETFELPQFVCTHECRIPVSSLLVKLVQLDPRMWTVHFSSKVPIRTEKRLIYEAIEVPDGAPVYFCHILELVDTAWLYED